MPSRRFVVLAAVLVVLNVVLWLAPAGLALRKAVIDQLFGPRMVRAEVVVATGTGASTTDYRLDRGVVTSATTTGVAPAISLREADGTVQTIPIAATTRVLGAGRLALPALARRGLQVLVVREANGPAISIQVEGGRRGFRAP
ncbi:MAG TPA: hypothetical protein VFJ91_10565 [Gaiellaceae bacterium]|nr:hypothetical protein [Gaiellaceae bacterium]